jgi:beta-mannosidase
MQRRIDLCGTWKLRWTDYQRGDKLTRLCQPRPDLSRAFDAQVPGEVHLDLKRAGLIGEPTEALGFLSSRWVEEMVWNYLRPFKAPALKPGERAWLIFETLDLAAVVFLNGREIGRHANAFHPFRIDVTAELKPGENQLLVSLEAGLYHGAEKPTTGYGGPENALSKRHWLRTVQSSFGWDWSNRLGNVGIRGRVALEIASDLRCDPMVATATLSDDLASGSVRIRIPVEGLRDKPFKVTLYARMAGAARGTELPVDIKPGAQVVETVLPVDRPDLWWPAGHGAQPLYAVKAVLRAENRTLASFSRRVGFRHVRVCQDPHPVKGRYFKLEVNRKPIFIKGGNWVPADPIPARIGPDRYAALVELALGAHFNLLRIWGGGLYESDTLYDLCDEKGILLWQEFIFACSRYPVTDTAFTQSVKTEAVFQVRRLAHHPSLVVWCGNNEIEQGYYFWGYDKDLTMPCHSLFHNILPRIVNAEDGTRFYLPSSPYSPDHESPTADHVGDQHPWSIGFTNTDFRNYRDMACRFPNEGGILGPTALPTLKACLPPGQRKPGSFAWEMTDNSVSFWSNQRHPDLMLEQWLGVKLENLSLEEFVYAGGLLQGEGLSEYIRNFRRRMFDTASAVFWMYNDCWPMIRSWTIVDYFLRRTPSYHPVKRAFQPLAVVVAREAGRIRIFGVNEGGAWTGRVRFGLFALAGGYPLDREQEAVLPANASTLLGEFPESALLKRGEATHGAFARLTDGGGTEVARDRLFLPFFKDMTWPRAAVRMRRTKGNVTFSSTAFAWRICLDLDGEKAYPDNFFDLLPGIPVTLAWPEILGAPKILRIGNDLFRKGKPIRKR